MPVTKRALVIGGGVAGIQAALDIADAGYEVVLVEREPSIGGKMAGLSETFPTLDCSQCILTPRMVEVGQHPNIKLHTYSRSRERSRATSATSRSTIRKKARYVDIDKCTGCGAVLERLPVEEDAQRVRLRHGQADGHLRAVPAGRARPAGDRRERLPPSSTKGKCGLCAEEVPGRGDQLRRRGPARHRGGRRDRRRHRLQALQHRQGAGQRASSPATASTATASTRT